MSNISPRQGGGVGGVGEEGPRWDTRSQWAHNSRVDRITSDALKGDLPICQSASGESTENEDETCRGEPGHERCQKPCHLPQTLS